MHFWCTFDALFKKWCTFDALLMHFWCTFEKCIKSASKVHQKCITFWKVHQKCIKSASLFWLIFEKMCQNCIEFLKSFSKIHGGLGLEFGNENAKACRTKGLECLGWLGKGGEGIWGNDNLWELLVTKCCSCDLFSKVQASGGQVECASCSPRKYFTGINSSHFQIPIPKIFARSSQVFQALRFSHSS